MIINFRFKELRVTRFDVERGTFLKETFSDTEELFDV